MSRYYPGISTGGGGGATISVDTLVNIEALTPAVGDRGFPTDSQYELLCKVAETWSYSFFGIDCVLPPTTGWTAFHAGSVAVVGGMRVLSLPAEAYSGWRGEQRSEPTDPEVTPYWVEFGIAMSWVGQASGTGALAAGATDATKMAILRAGGDTIAYTRYSTHTAFVANDADMNAIPLRMPFFIRIEEDGTNRRALLRQPDGTYLQFGPDVGRTVTLTADAVLWVASSHSADTGRKLALCSYDEGAL